MRDGRIVGAHTFWSLCFDPNLVRLNAQKRGDARLNFLCMGNDFRFSQDQRGIDIAHFVSGKPDLLQRFLKKNDGVGAFPPGIGGREIAADISGRDRAQQGIGNGVEKNVTIGMAGQAFGVGKLHAAYFQRDAGLKFV